MRALRRTRGSASNSRMIAGAARKSVIVSKSGVIGR